MHVEYSAKMNIAKHNGYMLGYLSYDIDNYGRLCLYNGFSTKKSYITKFNAYNTSRVLNASHSSIY